MDLTIMRGFCRGGNFRALMAQENLPPAFQEIRPIFDRFFGSALSGTVLADILSLGTTADGTDVPILVDEPTTSLPEETYHGLLLCLNRGHPFPCYVSYRTEPQPLTFAVEPRALQEKMVKINGATFTCASKHTGNSLVLFKLADETFERAGQIQSIFAHRRQGLEGKLITEFFYVIQQFKELTDEQRQHDPYRRFPLLCTRLCSREYLPSELVIKTHNIVSHFASCPYESRELPGGFHVVLSLNRVRKTYS
jgi:hypothetical protein